ncbi:MAG: hypothetical protein V9E89_03870 [Ilumatobacteraceae bacterium]|jgi:hypothetical protein
MAKEEPFIEVVDGPTRWRFEADFLRSTWTCIWGRGCQGILDHPAEDLQQGCCSVGAEMGDAEEAMTVSATAAAIPEDRWQYRHAVDAHDVFSDATRTNTKVVDGACVFLNRPGFGGGAGCALHLAAEDLGESPLDWKPSVCWQLPVRVDWDDHPDGTETATVRRWSRADWGAEGTTMAWCCTEAPEPYCGDQPVVESLAAELRGICGDRVYEAVAVRLRGDRR